MIQILTIDLKLRIEWLLSRVEAYKKELVFDLSLPGCCAFASFNTDCSKFLLAV